MNEYVSPEQILHARGALLERYSPGAPVGNDQPEPLETFSAASLATLPTPRRAFLDSEGLFPCRNVTMISGDGGTGKSLLAMQLSAAVSLGVPWLGISVQQGKVLYLSAEDDQDETHIRLNDISAAESLDLSAMTGLEIAVLAGRDAVLAIEEMTGSKMALTPLFERLRQRMIRQWPSLLVLDNLADIFAGNENVRPLARQFVSSLRALAIEFDCVVLLLAHPSLSGMASGTGTSGNTAWNNSVRSRLYLVRSGDELDPNGRVLQTMKANYGPTGGRISLRWEAGRFINGDRASASANSRSTPAMQAERVCLHLVRWHSEKGITVSPSRSSSFAPVVFAKHPQSEGVSKQRFEQAIAVLLERNELTIESFGPPSKRRQTIVVSKKNAAGQ